MYFHVCHNNRITAISNLAIPNISLFIDMEGNPYSVNVLRSFLCCKRVETLFPNTVVHSVNICTDSVRGSDNLSDFEMNCTSNYRTFIQQMEERRWKINKIYVNHYRMPDLYLTQMFRKGFFENSKKLAKSHLFHCNPHNPNIIPVVYLTFTPHVFVSIHRYKFNEEYDMSYSTHHELFDYRHKLYSASEDIAYHILSNIFDLTLRNQMRYCCTSNSANL